MRVLLAALLFLSPVFATLSAQVADSLDYYKAMELDSIAKVQYKQKNMEGYAAAIASWKEAAEYTAKFHGERHLEVARIHNNIAATYKKKGEYINVRNHHKKALAIRLANVDIKNKENNDPKLVDRILKNYKFIGEASERLGEYEQAIANHDAALEFIGKDEHSQKPNILRYKAQALQEKKGQFLDESIQLYKQAIAIFKQREDSEEVGKTLYDLGNAYNKKQDYPSALNAYLEAYAIFSKATGDDKDIDLFNTSLNLGGAYNQVGDVANAEKFIKQASTLIHQLLPDYKYHPEFAYPLDIAGDFYKNKNDYSLALQNYDNALDNIISGFGGIKDKLPQQAMDSIFFIGQKRHAIAVLASRADCLYQLGKKQEALHCYGFIGKLTAMLRQDLETESSNLHWISETRAIYADAVHLALELGRNDLAYSFMEKSKAVLLLENLQLSLRNQNANLPDSLHQRLNLLKQEAAALNDDLIYATLDKSADAFSIRNQLFAKQQELREFNGELDKRYPKRRGMSIGLHQNSLEEFQAHLLERGLWAVEFFEHAEKEEYTVLVITPEEIRSRRLPLSPGTRKRIQDWIVLISQPSSRSSDLERLGQYGFANHRDLLESLDLPKGQDLLIIPDGILQFVPFEALLGSMPQKGQPMGEWDYLLMQHYISYAYSASVHMQLNAQMREHSKGSLVISPEHYADLPDLISGEGGRISQIIKGDLLLGNQADSPNFIKMASHYDLLHLSTHASADDSQLGQPWIAFSDKKLLLSELYSLDINARLVTLSACETARGDLIRGEGVMSMARAFSFVGVPQVVTSLWAVNESSSSDIMETFYRNMNQGDSPSRALTEAKRQYVQQADLSQASPYYWAAFIAVGPDSYSYSGGFSWYLWVVLGMGVVMILWVGKRWWK